MLLCHQHSSPVFDQDGMPSSWLWRTPSCVFTMAKSLRSSAYRLWSLSGPDSATTISGTSLKVVYTKSSLPVLQTLQSKSHEGRGHNDRHTGCQVRSSVLCIHTHGRSWRNILPSETSAVCITYSWLESTCLCNCILVCNWLECVFPLRTSFAFLEII